MLADIRAAIEETEDITCSINLKDHVEDIHNYMINEYLKRFKGWSQFILEKMPLEL